MKIGYCTKSAMGRQAFDYHVKTYQDHLDNMERFNNSGMEVDEFFAEDWNEFKRLQDEHYGKTDALHKG